MNRGHMRTLHSEFCDFEEHSRQGAINYARIQTQSRVNRRLMKICLLFSFTDKLLGRIFMGQSSLYSVRLISQMIRGMTTPVIRLAPLRPSNNFFSGARRFIWITRPTYSGLLSQIDFRLWNQNLRSVGSELSKVHGLTPNQIILMIYDAVMYNDEFIEYEKRMFGFNHYLMTSFAWTGMSAEQALYLAQKNKMLERMLR
jgi:hypothetical protein